ncbi:hypothetical protein [Stakelama marina]|uniref:Uncharacterized protein n=1 Tax=Stakelama marina TaxID=2826939 RepID=A0A8T4I8H9_9SPHN|nr:hypothetical protein [Stakelama marina]MBR0550967.1 hypothetical protein [Stakelama marina]
MTIPAHSLPDTAMALTEVLKTTGFTRVAALGRPSPFIEDALACHVQSVGGALKVLGSDWGPKAIPSMGDGWAWVLSDVRNYHAAYHQLYAVDAYCRRHNQPMLVLMPHVLGEVARRDHYPRPYLTPPAWRKRTEEVPGTAGLRRAIATGGARNGVVTAVEDMVSERSDMGAALTWAHLPALNGLGALFDTDAEWAPRLAGALANYHTSSIIAAMSARQIREYLAMLDGRNPPC